MLEERGGSRDQEKDCEDGDQQIAEPLDAAEEVVNPLGCGQPQPVPGERQHLAPVHAQDLDAAQRPAETLLLQPVERQRHQSLAVGRRHVDP